MDTTTTHRCELTLPADTFGPAATHLRLGALGEELAAHHLVADDGLTIVTRNWRPQGIGLRGELDLVARDDAGGTLIVCEVKTRRDAGRFGGAACAVSPRKQAQIRALTAAFLRGADGPHRQVRLDLIAIDLAPTPVLTHLVAAL